MDFLESVADFIQKHQLLDDGQKLVVGVSGGPDSVCLLDCLVRLGFQPIPVYVDHGLRPESADEAEFVSRLATSLGLAAVVRQVDVPAMLEGKGGSLEEQARWARYSQLIEVADEHDLDTLATAHQADDQIETVLMHLLRGGGVAGLRGMKPSTDLTGWFGADELVGRRLVRPLLALDGGQIHAYLQARGLAYRVDASNDDLSFRRNRVRHELIPYLQSYNPAIRTNLARLARIMAEQADWTEQVVAERWAEVVVGDDSHQLVLDRSTFNQLPPALQSELMREVLARLRFGRLEPDYALIQAAVLFCRGGSKRLVLAGGVQIQRVADQVILGCEGAALHLPQFPQMISDEPSELPMPGEVALANGWRLTVASTDLSNEERQRWFHNQDENRVALDLDSLTGSLMLRTRDEGDRIKPLGMHGTMKLSDLFINQGIPFEARSLWPVVVHKDQIVWVAGLKMADAFRLRPSSIRAVVIEVTPPGSHADPAPFLEGCGASEEG